VGACRGTLHRHRSSIVTEPRRAQRAPQAWMHPPISRAHLGSRCIHGPRECSSRDHVIGSLSSRSRVVTSQLLSRVRAIFGPKRRRATRFPGWPFRTVTSFTSSG